jgi:hypothetical protein
MFFGDRPDTDGQTDMKMLAVPFRNFANTRQNVFFYKTLLSCICTNETIKPIKIHPRMRRLQIVTHFTLGEDG